MESSNHKKAELLGMPFGTASARLKKMLLWHFVKQLGMDTCYQCGQPIDSIEDFSIEHTEPWMSAEDPAEVFFDVEKIAFSHTHCNFSAAVRPHTLYASKTERNRALYQREGVAAQTKTCVRHGTVSGYVHDRCRCVSCRKANSAREAARQSQNVGV